MLIGEVCAFTMRPRVRERDCYPARRFRGMKYSPGIRANENARERRRRISEIAAVQPVHSSDSCLVGSFVETLAINNAVHTARKNICLADDLHSRRISSTRKICPVRFAPLPTILPGLFLFAAKYLLSVIACRNDATRACRRRKGGK